MIKGVFYSLTASALFGGIFMLAGLLRSMSAEEVFSWRVVISTPLLLTVLLAVKRRRALRPIWDQVRGRPAMGLWLLFSAGLLGVQLWLFMWAPQNGRAMDVSLGYFMLPIVMVLIGRFGYREKLSRPQFVAALCASAGVLNAMISSGGVSWAALLVALGYPLYFALRRRFWTDGLPGHVVDMLILTPVATAVLLQQNAPGALLDSGPWTPASVVLLGILSAAAMMSYILAVGRLPFALFGLLSYVEPVLLLVVSFMLGESIAPSEWLTYIPIWIAVAVLALEGLIHTRSRRA